MTSKTMKQQPCWFSKSIFWEWKSFLMKTFSFVPVKLHGCWPHEGKHFIGLKIVSFLMSFSLFNFILDGLMSLLKQIGQGYVHLSSYECKQALNAFSALAPHHYNTGWVLTQVGRAHFELAEYQLVKYCYL